MDETRPERDAAPPLAVVAAGTWHYKPLETIHTTKLLSTLAAVVHCTLVGIKLKLLAF